MSTKQDGGPAFPVGFTNFKDVIEGPGMSLRDWFAGQALVGILSNQELLLAMDSLSTNSTRAVAAANAYRVADAMLAERVK